MAGRAVLARCGDESAPRARRVRRLDLLRRSGAIAAFAAATFATARSPAALLDAFVPESGYRFVPDRRFRAGGAGLLSKAI